MYASRFRQLLAKEESVFQSEASLIPEKIQEFINKMIRLLNNSS